MLPKYRRLSRRDLCAVSKNGLTIKTNSLALKHLHTSQAFSRFAIIVSTKVFPKSHDRNEIKRHIYHLVEAFSSKVDVIIILYPQVVNLTHEEIDTCIYQALSKISLL